MLRVPEICEKRKSLTLNFCIDFLLSISRVNTIHVTSNHHFRLVLIKAHISRSEPTRLTRDIFQVGRLDLRLISPDRKKVLLHKQLRDVASCAQGIKNPEHFGFICRDSGDRFVGYIFKCQSESVADDLKAGSYIHTHTISVCFFLCAYVHHPRYHLHIEF